MGVGAWRDLGSEGEVKKILFSFLFLVSVSKLFYDKKNIKLPFNHLLFCYKMIKIYVDDQLIVI